MSSRIQPITVFAALALGLLCGAPPALAHDYFVGASKKPQKQNKIVPGATILVPHRGKVVLLVKDTFGCPADLTPSIVDTSIATISPTGTARAVSKSYVISAKSSGLTTLNLQVVGVGSITVDGNEIDCGENETRTFEICVLGDEKRWGKALSKLARREKKAFNKTLRTKAAALKATNDVTLLKLKTGTIEYTDAVMELIGNYAAAKQASDDCWRKGLQNVIADASSIRGSGLPCGPPQKDFCWGGGGVWDAFVSQMSECRRRFDEKLRNNLRRIVNAAQKTPAAGINEQPGLALISLAWEPTPPPIDVASPAGEDALIPRFLRLTMGTRFVCRFPGESATVSVRGKADPANGEMTVVLDGPTHHELTVPAGAEWSALFSNVTPGEYVLSIRYSGDRPGSGVSRVLTVR